MTDASAAIDVYFDRPVPQPSKEPKKMPDPPIRLATIEDEAEILRLLALLHEENGQHAINQAKVQYWIRPYLMQDGGILAVIGEPTDIKAMLCLTIDEVWYSDEMQLLELFNYVRPDARRSNYAKRLIAYAKNCSDETNLDLLIGVLSNTRMEAKVRLYSRLLPKGGEFFVYAPASKRAATAAG
jgi:N-acetylglutamate synthase-like GNAT family acetyltransferase